jgi:hypothetical protein
MNKSRLLNKIFEDPCFKIDEESIPYIVRDIINMNWWNTCNFLIGYNKNKWIEIPCLVHSLNSLSNIITLKLR